MAGHGHVTPNPDGSKGEMRWAGDLLDMRSEAALLTQQAAKPKLPIGLSVAPLLTSTSGSATGATASRGSRRSSRCHRIRTDLITWSARSRFPRLQRVQRETRGSQDHRHLSLYRRDVARADLDEALSLQGDLLLMPRMSRHMNLWLREEQKAQPPGLTSYGWGGGPVYSDAFRFRRAPSLPALAEAYKSIIYTCVRKNSGGRCSRSLEAIPHRPRQKGDVAKYGNARRATSRRRSCGSN